MRMSYLKTQAAKYFLGLFEQISLVKAVEVAAEREREAVLPGFQCPNIPVNLDRIIEKKGIRFGADLSIDSTEEAILIPNKRGYELRLNPNLTDFRRRFTVAHEIGHTFFYRNMKHQINLLDRREIETEEKICSMFAGFLLMPTDPMLSLISRIPNKNPGDVLSALEKASLYFKVSIPALISRIMMINKPTQSISCMVLHFHIRENKYTERDSRPRVRSGISLGKLSNIRIWSNQSVKSLNLQSVENLFKEWKNQLNCQREPLGGRYALPLGGNLIDASPDTLEWIPEEVNLSVLREGKWYEEKIPVLTSSLLYARQGWGEKQAYVISILKSEIK